MIQEVAKAKSRSEILTEVLTFVLVVLISTFLLRVVWNRSLVKHISILKPISNLTDAFILSLAIVPSQIRTGPTYVASNFIIDKLIQSTLE
jgi:hypothetical protein